MAPRGRGRGRGRGSGRVLSQTPANPHNTIAVAAASTTNTAMLPPPPTAIPAPAIPTPAIPTPNLTPAQRAARSIRGPQSALTDFLASHNINANQIRREANARRDAALAAQANGEDEDDEDASPVPEKTPGRKNESKAQAAKRKKEEEKAIAKIKASKRFQKRRENDDDSADEDEAARAIYERSHAPLGQMENCEICEKRFSVTGYSRSGPDGGLLCPKCSKDLEKEKGHARKKRKTAEGNNRRKIQSNLLDGIYPGAKSLVTLCIETLAKNVEEAESFGDLPSFLVDKLAAILSKRRLINSKTLDLFLKPGVDSLTVYDGAKLTFDDYIRIFQIVQSIKHLRLRNAIQFKNKVMDHLLGTTINLESLSLHGSNLIDDVMWNRYFIEKGSHLRAFKLYYTDGHFGDEEVCALVKNCPDLERLKIAHNQKVTDKGIAAISKLRNLKYLSLEIYETPSKKTSSPPCVEILNNIGAGLRTFSISRAHHIDDSVLEAVHKNCRQLNKLRITDNEFFTDEAFVNLFTNWSNPPLTFIDFHKCRHCDSSEPRDNTPNIGLCSKGFSALMAHSGKKLKFLKIDSCRHISRETFEKVFGGEQRFMDLTEMDISFCQSVNDFVVGCIFRSCPNLKTLKVFGCFGVRDVRVPKGKILIGVPTAQGMQIEGTEEDEGRVI